MTEGMDNTGLTLAEIVKKLFGGPTTAKETVVAVTSARVILLPNNPNRFRWMLINEGVNDVRVSIDPNITAASGWLLPSGGGVMEMNMSEDGSVVGWQLYAITAAADVDVRALEELRL